MRTKNICRFAFVAGLLTASISRADAPRVERWALFDTSLPGPKTGNPFSDVTLTAKFTHANQTLSVHGFYDGDGLYRIHFMPPDLGQWDYLTQSNIPELSGIHGSLVCIQPSPPNHGPVRVRNIHHFAYADGSPFFVFGTTCYGWANEPDAIEDQTLATLKTSPFNKVRMILLPGDSSPLFYPYARDAAGHFDPNRFNPDFFRHLEKRIQQLGDQGVEADVILFNPYHKGAMEWFDDLDDAADDRYLNYVVARLSA